MTMVNKEKQMQNLIRRTIIESVVGILGDPDYDIGIRSGVEKRLKKYSSKTPRKSISLKDLKKKYS
jgi:hypothetical protein